MTTPSGWQTCPVCGGEGWTYEKDHKCQRCAGTGMISAAMAEVMKREDLQPIAPLISKVLLPAADLEGALEARCIDCGALFELPAIVLGLPADWRKPFQRCEHCQMLAAEEGDAKEVAARRAEWDNRIARWWEKVWQKQPKYREDSFTTFQPNANSEDVAVAYDAARRWAERFDWRHPDAISGLVLHSAVRGTGKTHLLLAICRRVLERCAPDDARLRELVSARDNQTGGPSFQPVQFWKADDLLMRIDQSRRPVRFDSDAPKQATEQEIYEGLSQVRLLVIDDLGQAPSFTSGMRQSAAWEKIVGDRYNRSLPILFSTNLCVLTDENEVHPEFAAVVGARAVSRLQEMADFVSCAGVDYRPRKRAR